MPVAERTRHGARPRTRPRPAPVRARRVSGPMRPAPAGPAVRRGTTGVFERIRALPETRVVDGLLRGRAWIWLIGILLGGIVAMQVSLLKLNAGISRAVTTSATLERQNADFEADIARLSSGDRVRAAALEEGMVAPPPGGVEYLTAREGDRDPSRAARRMQPPSEEAIAIEQNGGRVPGVLAPDPATLVQTAPADAAVTTDPAATTVTPTTTTTDPAATTDPTATATPPPTDPATGAAAAPGQG